MARARNIKPGFYKNEELAECDIWARFIFPGLWTLSDRRGVLEDRPKRIKGELLPFDSQNVDKLLQELHERKFILRYEVDGRRCIQILKFKKHQNPHHKETVNDLPAPPESMLRSLGLVLVDGWYESGAPDLFNQLQTSGKPRSSPADSLNPITDSPNPDSGNLNPESLDCAPGRAPDEAGVRVWHAYKAAFKNRYGVEPVRNAKVNGQIGQFVKRVPTADAPHVAAFYCTHQLAKYVRAHHPVGMLLADAEGLYAQWKAGRQVTDAEARGADKTAGGLEQVNRLLADAARGRPN